jgi:negative modulator of initiation of replication
MKTVELSDATYTALEQLAGAKGTTPAEIIAALLGVSRPPLAGDALLFHLTSSEFTALADPADRYLALLSWVAKSYAMDFADFIAHQESGHRYLALSRDDIQEIRQRNRAQPIPATQYWAVMSIDPATKRRFVRRLLEFIGCHDETVALACRTLDLGETTAAAPCVLVA